MKHVVVYLQPDTCTLEIALLWPCLSPIGPRLEKTLPMPKLPTKGYTELAPALAAAQEFDQWLIRQDRGDRVEVAPPLPQQVKEVLEIKPLPPAPTPPPPLPPEVKKPAPPPPKPKPKQDDLFSDL